MVSQPRRWQSSVTTTRTPDVTPSRNREHYENMGYATEWWKTGKANQMVQYPHSNFHVQYKVPTLLQNITQSRLQFSAAFDRIRKIF